MINDYLVLTSPACPKVFAFNKRVVSDSCVGYDDANEISI